MPIEKSDLLQGTLDMLILKIVALGPVHGYGISLRIRQISKEVLQVQQGSLYPALHRLEKRGWLEAEWGESDKGRQAKFYKLSVKGPQAIGERRIELESSGGCGGPHHANRGIGASHVLVEIHLSEARFRRSNEFRTPLPH